MLIYLVAARRWLSRGAKALGMSAERAGLLAKTAPILGIFLSMLASYLLGLEALGLKLIGNIPASLPIGNFLYRLFLCFNNWQSPPF